MYCVPRALYCIGPACREMICALCLAVERAARLLGKSKDTIYRWLEEGKLSGRKVGGRWIIYQDSVEAAWEAEVVERE